MSNAIVLSGASGRLTNVFWGVVDAYIEHRQRPVLTAVNHDEMTPNRKWCPETALFLADVTLAVRKALGDSPQRIREWTRLVMARATEQDRLPNSETAKVIKLCGREFMKRDLLPGKYFRRTKKGAA